MARSGLDVSAPRPVLTCALGQDPPAADEALSSATVATVLRAGRSCTPRTPPFAVTGERRRTPRSLRSCGLLDEGAGRWR